MTGGAWEGQNALTLKPEPAPLNLVLRGGTVVTPDGERRTDLGLSGGRIAALGKDLVGRADFDASGLHLLPGGVDMHVHFNDPGRADWEGWDSGSRAALAGGVTTVVDMPLNASPPTVNAEALWLKREAARRSYADYALWGGLVQGNVAELAELHAGGVAGFKAFMIDSGMPDFAFVEGEHLREGMAEIARLGGLLLVHAEDQALVAANVAALRTAGRRDPLAWAQAHSVEAEVRAVRAALDLARATGCRLHVVHVSTPEAVDLITAARAAGQAVTLETCPQYLTLTEDDLVRLGPLGKCAPPPRDPARVEALWDRVRAGLVDAIASDHSPSPLALKTPGEADIWAAWGGVQGVQTLLPLTLTDGLRRGLDLTALARLLSTNPARIAGLENRKGALTPGLDADITAVRLNAPWTLAPQDLLYRHPHSPYLGRELSVRVERVWLRGREVYDGGRVLGDAGGQFLNALEVRA